MASALAARYAKALADVVLKPGTGIKPEEMVSRILTFDELYRNIPNLKSILLSPAVPGARKRAVIARLAATLGIAGVVKNFLWVVSDRRRLAELRDICGAFEALLDERRGVVRVDVASAREMAAPQQEAVRGELARFTGRQVRANFAVEPELLGGVVAKIGSTIYDGSVQGQLQALRQKLEAE